MRVPTQSGGTNEEESGSDHQLAALLPNRYRIESVLGRGGSGVVFAAHDQALRRRVAVKVLRCVSADASKRMLREARICAALHHEHIVRVFDIGYLPDTTPFLVMELLDGTDLGAIVARGPLEIATAIQYVLQTCDAVAHAHDAGIVHRDLKPTNLFAAQSIHGTSIKVLDFGLSKLLHGFVSPDTLPATSSGIVIGTPAYMSPEQLFGDRELDTRADIWALGVILFELLTGSRPFVAESLPALAIAIATAEPRDPRTLRPDLPLALVTTLRDCLAKSRSDRIPTVRALVDDLRARGTAPARRGQLSRRRGKAVAVASPAIRTSAVRDTLAFLDKFESGSRQRVLERIPAASREIIECSPRSSWIPIEHDHWLIDSIVELFGTARAIQCWCDSLVALVKRPFLRTFVSGSFAVLGSSPVSVVRIFVKGWPMVYRNLCEPKLIATVDGQPTIRFENIVPEVRRYSNYLHCWHGACRAFTQLARVQGEVSFQVAPDLAWAEAKFFWHEGGGLQSGRLEPVDQGAA